MATTFTCDICHNNVYVTNIYNGVNFDEYYLSCGHVNKKQGKSRTKKDYEGTINEEKEMVQEMYTTKKQATCKFCGLTARSSKELDEHINHAHDPSITKADKISSEQKVDPFPADGNR
ncbi:MAG: hypothetical protein M3250_03280 [Thermoproteota archaeon]|nr:hypothetical protein [Thermoproteota archaeon]